MKEHQLILDFLTGLIHHNNREWFAEHRPQYDEAWALFNHLIEDLIQEMSTFDSSIAHLEPKDCTYRIYRDLRFSPDKTPYKGHFAAYINAEGKKAYYGGYYIQIEPRQLVVASGVWWLPTKEMHALRHAIVDQMETFSAIVEAPEFKRICPEIGMERYKRIPSGYPKDFPHPEYLLCKNYTCACYLPAESLLQTNCVQDIADKFKCMKPFNDFLRENIRINQEEMESMKDVVKFF